MLRITEIPNEEDSLNFGYYLNSIWCIVITMMTGKNIYCILFSKVGYGDVYPITILGRIVIFFVCILGVFLISMMILTVTNTL